MIGDRWGVDESEIARAYPCDAFVDGPELEAWRGVSVEAPAAAVWPWIGQVRLAPYAYDWIDNLGRRSPRELVELPEPRVGEAFTTVGGRKRGRILSVDPGEQLTATIMGAFLSYVLVTHEAGVPEARERETGVPAAREGEAGGTRLLLKVVMRTRRWMAPGLAVGDLVMARRQLLNFKELAERKR